MEHRPKRRLVVVLACMACVLVVFAVAVCVPGAMVVAPRDFVDDVVATMSERSGSLFADDGDEGAERLRADATRDKESGADSAGRSWGSEDSADEAEGEVGADGADVENTFGVAAQEDADCLHAVSTVEDGATPRSSGGVVAGAEAEDAGGADQQSTDAAPETLGVVVGTEDEADADVVVGAEEESLITTELGDDKPFVMPEGTEYEPEEILVRVDPDARVEDVEKLLASTPGIAAQAVDAEDVASGLLVVELEPGTSVEDGVNAVLGAGAGMVAGSQPNYVYYLAEELTAADLRARLDEAAGFAEAEAVEAALEGEADTVAAGTGPVDDGAVGDEVVGGEDASDAEVVVEDDAEATEGDGITGDSETAGAAEVAEDATTGVGAIEPDAQDGEDVTEADAGPDEQADDEPRLSLQERLAASIDDPRASEQWALTSMRVYEAWAQAKCEGTVSVAVLDNGFQIDHGDLAANVVPGSAYNAYAASVGEEDTTDVSPISSNTNHGTHVAGIVGAVANNGIGVAGVSYNAGIVPIKVFYVNSEGNAVASTASLVRAFTYVMSHADEYGVKVITMSLGMAYENEDFEDQAFFGSVRKAASQGIVTVAAACNSGTKYADDTVAALPFYAWPADSESIVSVINLRGSASSEGNDSSGAYTVSRSSSSNYNVAGQGGANTRKGKNISAPGTSVLSTIPGGDYGASSGTSMAAPAVAGVLALEFAANPQLSANMAVELLYETAHDLGDVGWDETYGHGEVDAVEAVRMAASGGFTTELDDGSKVAFALVLPDGGYEYNGTAKEPSVEVTLVDVEGVRTRLAPDVDFRLAYGSNIDAGLAQVTIVGAGAYEGLFEQILHFTIACRTLTEAMVGLSSTSWIYDARPLRPAIVLKDGGVTLVRNEAYTCTYTYERNEDVGTGLAHITVAGTGNYTGQFSVTREFTISRRDVNHEKISAAMEATTYNGRPQQPDVCLEHKRGVAVDGEMIYTLVEGVDYTLSYSDNNVNVGTATVTVTGMGNYAGTRAQTFSVMPATLAQGDASVTPTSYVWGGRAVVPVVVVSHDGVALAQGADYTVAYADNAHVGTATVTVTGVGNYQGTATATFLIVMSANPMVARAKAASQSTTYSATAAKTLAANVTASKAQGAVTYANASTDATAKRFAVNKATGAVTVPKATAAGTYVVKVKVTAAGSGNYAAGIATVSFKVVVARASLAKATVAGISAQAYTGQAVKPKPTVKLGGVTLKRGTDYTLQYKGNVKAGTATVTVAGKGNYTGSRAATFRIVAPTVCYRVHRQTYGWETSWTRDGGISGTTGESKRLEGIRIKLGSSFPVSGGIAYRTHVQTYGWETAWAKDGALSGTTGQSKRLEAIQIKLTGAMAQKYDVWYRVHAQTYGWLGWAKNGAKAGTAGLSKRLEAIQIAIVPKGGKAPGATMRPYVAA